MLMDSVDDWQKALRPKVWEEVDVGGARCGWMSVCGRRVKIATCDHFSNSEPHRTFLL